MQALGIGFSGIDIIKNNNNELIMPGGTCGNVMSALASLHWNANIIKSRYKDYWNDMADLLWESLKVNIINCGTVNYALPRIVGVINDENNRYYTTCPQCGKKLVGFVSPTRAKLNSLGIDTSAYDILFYDRITDGVKYLLDKFLQNNKWTFYEPNSAHNYNTWANNILSCHIVKFSEDRIPRRFFNKLIDTLNSQNHNTKIVVITHSNHGYSYSIANGKKMTELKNISVRTFDNVIDSSGAGDWLTAGFIDKLLQKYKTPPEIFDEQVIVNSLAFGHSLAKEACSYIGALGKLFSDKKYIESPNARFICDFCKSVNYN